jgi:hypothetical protein
LQSCNNDANVRSCNIVARLFFYAVKASSRQGAKRAQRRQEGAKTPRGRKDAKRAQRRQVFPPAMAREGQRIPRWRGWRAAPGVDLQRKTPSFPAGYGTRRTTYPPLAGVARSAGGGPAKRKLGTCCSLVYHSKRFLYALV